MASIRELKKDVKAMVYDVIDEAYSIQLYTPSKKEKSEALIDEAVGFYNDAITKINAANSKSEFKSLVSSFEEQAEKWIEKLNQL